MRPAKFFGLSFLSIVLPFTVQANVHGPSIHKRHQELANRSRGDLSLHQRGFDQARFTFYDVGLGACGQWNVPSDFIVALNTPQYGDGYPGPNCFKSITITWGGKTANAVIMDQCPGCPWGGLDMSRGLFTFFADEGVGVLYGSWWFNDGSNNPPPPPAPTTSTPPPPPPPPTTTSSSTWSPPPSSSSSSQSASASSSSTTSSTSSTKPADPLSEPTATPISGSHSINTIYQAVLGLGDAVAAGAQVAH